MTNRRSVFACVAAAWAAFAACPASGQTPFYTGKTLTILVGSSPAGYYDTSARIIARHLSEHIPGSPAIVVQNQPGAGGLALANKRGNTMDRDGLSIVVMSRALPQLALLDDPKATFDALSLTWLGSLSSNKDDAYLLLVNDAFPARDLESLKALSRPAILSGTRGGSPNITFALIARDLIWMNVDIVRGFPGANEIWLAMERDEVDGQIVDISAALVGRPQLWEQNKLHPFIAFGRTERLPDHPDVPIAREFVKDPKDRAFLEFAELQFFMALPVVAPPGIPADRAAVLKRAFMEMARGDAFRADMLKAGIMTSPIDGEAVLALLEKASRAPKEIRQRFRKLLSN